MSLADPEFGIPSRIDLLISAAMFWNIWSVSKIDLGSGNPMLQSTRLGWIIAGPINTQVRKSLCHFSQNPMSAEEKLCEKHFVENLKITSDGRFQLSIPLKILLASWVNLAKRLLTNSSPWKENLLLILRCELCIRVF